MTLVSAASRSIRSRASAIEQLVLYSDGADRVRLARGPARTRQRDCRARRRRGARGHRQYAALGTTSTPAAAGLLSHYMTYSGVLMLVVCTAAARLLFYRNARSGRLAVPALLVALVATQTRNAWIGAARRLLRCSRSAACGSCSSSCPSPSGSSCSSRRCTIGCRALSCSIRRTRPIVIGSRCSRWAGDDHRSPDARRRPQHDAEGLPREGTCRPTVTIPVDKRTTIAPSAQRARPDGRRARPARARRLAGLHRDGDP